MSDPFLGEVQIFGFNFAPQNWAFCNGATLALRQYTALYSLIGTSYGGNGTSTFQLPNLAIRTAMGQGSGPNLTPRSLGETVGQNGISLVQNEMAAHGHTLTAYAGGTGRVATPTPGAGLGPASRVNIYAPQGVAADAQFLATAVGPTGQNQPHENRQPFLALNYCIAINGVFPSFG